MKLRQAFPLAYMVLAIVATVVHLSEHGGIRGDYVVTDAIDSDVFSDIADLGNVFFNRWKHDDPNESVTFHLFAYLGLPGFMAAKFLVYLLGLTFEEMQRTFPFGLSYLSYIVGVGTPLAIVQWYWLGKVADQLRSKR